MREGLKGDACDRRIVLLAWPSRERIFWLFSRVFERPFEKRSQQVRRAAVPVAEAKQALEES